jgi:xanthine/uracil permease
MRTREPVGLERWLEERFPPYRYGPVLVLLSATFVLMASGPRGEWARVLNVALQGVTLLTALIASRVGRRLFRTAALVVGIALVSSLGASLVDAGERDGAYFLLSFLLAVTTPVVIGRALWQRAVIDIRTVTGAICIYVLIGMLFSFVYATAAAFDSEGFFVQTNHATVPEFLYFSYVTLATVGYGDYTAAHGLGRALAVVEALSGQLYLVTVIAVLVSRLAGRRRGPGDEA